MPSKDPNAAAKPPTDHAPEREGTLVPMLIAGLVLVTVGYAIIMMFV